MSTNDRVDAIRGRMAKVLEMLRSPFDGERLSAVDRANAILSQAGMTWTEFVFMDAGKVEENATTDQPHRTRRYQEQSDRYYCELAFQLMEHPDFDTMTAKQQEFVETMATRWNREVSEMQRKWLDGLAEKFGVMERAA
jgi:hypothetical protein